MHSLLTMTGRPEWWLSGDFSPQELYLSVERGKDTVSCDRPLAIEISKQHG